MLRAIYNPLTLLSSRLLTRCLIWIAFGQPSGQDIVLLVDLRNPSLSTLDPLQQCSLERKWRSTPCNRNSIAPDSFNHGIIASRWMSIDHNLNTRRLCKLHDDWLPQGDSHNF